MTITRHDSPQLIYFELDIGYSIGDEIDLELYHVLSCKTYPIKGTIKLICNNKYLIETTVECKLDKGEYLLKIIKNGNEFYTYSIQLQ